MASSNGRHTLLDNLPRAGFRWPEGNTLLTHSRRDRRILRVLRDRAGATFLAAGARVGVRLVRHQLDAILASIFDMAADDTISGVKDRFDTLEHYVEDLGSRIPWVRGLQSKELFSELFVRLCAARRAWEERRCEPFDVEEHGALAHAIDRFHRAARPEFVDLEVDFFRMARDPREAAGEEGAGDDLAAAAPHTQGTDAHAAAGEPHPQTPSASGGSGEDEDEDEDGDVKMDDGEEEDGRVREVRLHLAATNLREDMEVDE